MPLMGRANISTHIISNSLHVCNSHLNDNYMYGPAQKWSLTIKKHNVVKYKPKHKETCILENKSANFNNSVQHSASLKIKSIALNIHDIDHILSKACSLCLSESSTLQSPDRIKILILCLFIGH